MIRLKSLLTERIQLDATQIQRVAAEMGERITGELGRGANGVAFITESGHVLKITTDEREAALASRLRTKRVYKHIVNVYNVRRFNAFPQGFFVIVMDRIDPLTDTQRDIWDEVRGRYFNRSISNEEFQRLSAAEHRAPDAMQFIATITTQRTGILRDFSELRINSGEAHGENMGWNRHGSLVHFDAWQWEHYTKTTRTRWTGEPLRDLEGRIKTNINQQPYRRGMDPDINL